MIGLLPEITNSNNKAISDYIDKIYDSSNNRIITNVYAIDDKSFVKSHLGEFVQCRVDSLEINNTDSKKNLISGLDHSLLGNRFMTIDGTDVIEQTSVDTKMKQFAHNANAIGVEVNGDVKSLQEVMDSLSSGISTTSIQTYGTSVMSYANDIEDPKSFTFDNSLIFTSRVQLQRMGLPAYQFNDLLRGCIYTYYDTTNNNVCTIDDRHIASLQSAVVGSVVTVKFDDTQSANFYRIILSRKDSKSIKISKDKLNRLKLVCISNDDEYGTEWDVESYSVRHADDIEIENILK